MALSVRGFIRSAGDGHFKL
jgi:hypothetical protein